jgi:hypothetical protein
MPRRDGRGLHRALSTNLPNYTRRIIELRLRSTL